MHHPSGYAPLLKHQQPDRFHGDGLARGLHEAEGRVRHLAKQIRFEKPCAARLIRFAAEMLLVVYVLFSSCR